MLRKLFAVSWTRSLRRFEMRAENFTVAGVMSLNRQIRRTSSASAKSDSQYGRPVWCAAMRVLATGESGWLGLARSSTVPALLDGEFAAKKHRCELVAGAVEDRGSLSVLRKGFSLALGEFLSRAVDATMTADAHGTDGVNDLGFSEIDGLVSDGPGAVGAGKSPSLRMVGATLILTDTGSSVASLWSDSKSASGMAEGGSGSSNSVIECGTFVRPNHGAASVGFSKVSSAARVSEVTPSLCSALVFGAGTSVSSLVVPASQAVGSAEFDTGDVAARWIAIAVANEDRVFAERMSSAIRRGACAPMSRTELDSKSGDQWSVH